jgi:hypothetical protein
VLTELRSVGGIPARLQVARDSQEALGYLLNHANDLPRLVLLDLRLPNIDGTGSRCSGALVTSRGISHFRSPLANHPPSRSDCKYTPFAPCLRPRRANRGVFPREVVSQRSERTRLTPAVILTSFTAPDDVATGYRYGVNSYVCNRSPSTSSQFSRLLRELGLGHGLPAAAGNDAPRGHAAAPSCSRRSSSSGIPSEGSCTDITWLSCCPVGDPPPPTRARRSGANVRAAVDRAPYVWRGAVSHRRRGRDLSRQRGTAGNPPAGAPSETRSPLPLGATKQPVPRSANVSESAMKETRGCLIAQRPRLRGRR